MHRRTLLHLFGLTGLALLAPPGLGQILSPEQIAAASVQRFLRGYIVDEIAISGQGAAEDATPRFVTFYRSGDSRRVNPLLHVTLQPCGEYRWISALDCGVVIPAGQALVWEASGPADVWLTVTDRETYRRYTGVGLTTPLDPVAV